MYSFPFPAQSFHLPLLLFMIHDLEQLHSSFLRNLGQLPWYAFFASHLWLSSRRSEAPSNSVCTANIVRSPNCDRICPTKIQFIGFIGYSFVIRLFCHQYGQLWRQQRTLNLITGWPAAVCGCRATISSHQELPQGIRRVSFIPQKVNSMDSNLQSGTLGILKTYAPYKCMKVCETKLLAWCKR